MFRQQLEDVLKSSRLWLQRARHVLATRTKSSSSSSSPSSMPSVFPSEQALRLFLWEGEHKVVYDCSAELSDLRSEQKRVKQWLLKLQRSGTLLILNYCLLGHHVFAIIYILIIWKCDDEHLHYLTIH